MPLAKIDVRLLVQDHLDRKTDGKKVFKDNLPGPDWIDGFVAQHIDRITCCRQCEGINNFCLFIFSSSCNVSFRQYDFNICH